MTTLSEEDSEIVAYVLYEAGFEPSFSSGICGSTTAGYGKLDSMGYWEYPLMVDQETYKILEN